MELLVVGKLVKGYREKLPGSPSLRKFAKDAGVNYVTLSKIENGKSGASQEMISKLAKALKRKPIEISIPKVERAVAQEIPIGQRILIYRGMKNLSAEEFLKKLTDAGMPRAIEWLNGIENGVIQIKAYELDFIMKLLGWGSMGAMVSVTPVIEQEDYSEKGALYL